MFNYHKKLLLLISVVSLTSQIQLSVAMEDQEPTTRAHRAKKQELMSVDPSGKRYQVWLDSRYEWVCPSCKQWSRAFHTYAVNPTNRDQIFKTKPPAYVCHECMVTIKPKGDKSITIIKSDHQ